MNLAEKKRRLLRFHWVEMEILEIVASWSETMVFLPIRAGVGRVMWEQALNCNSIGWALRNLRHLGRVTTSQAPTDEFVRYCEQLHAIVDPAPRLVSMFRVLVPALAEAERAYLESTDALADANSVESLNTCLAAHASQVRWAEHMLAALLPTPVRWKRAADFEHEQHLLLLSAGGIDTNGPAAYYLPYHGWPEHDEASSARREVPAAHGQWRSAGYTYTKSFEPNVVHLRWDTRFRYAEFPEELAPPAPAGTIASLVRWLHDLFHGECQTVDRMGWLLVDFPDLPWAMRMDMAQQAWEESRHIQVVAQLLEGLGGQLGSLPFQPYFGHRRRDHHHPVAHLVTGNIIGEGSAAAETNEALRLTRGWDNDWLRHGLEHLSGDEVVHISFGKKWARMLIQEDHVRYWEEGKEKAIAGQRALEETKRAFGFVPNSIAGPERIEREFLALLKSVES